jgi:hypothetical protein
VRVIGTSLRDFLKIQDYSQAEVPSFQAFESGPWLAITTAGEGDPNNRLSGKSCEQRQGNPCTSIGDEDGKNV